MRLRLVNTGCWGCRYNGYDGVCKKDGVCNGVESFPTYMTTTSSPTQNYSYLNMPDELEINGVTYRRAEE